MIKVLGEQYNTILDKMKDDPLLKMTAICHRCKGKGRIMDHYKDLDFTCPICEGKGVFNNEYKNKNS